MKDTAAVRDSFAPVVTAFARDRSVSRGKMFSSSNVLSVNGKIFAMLNNDKLVVKLPKQRVDELVAARVGTYFDPGHGRLMKQWISIHPGRAPWIGLARDAYTFVKRPRLDSQMADTTELREKTRKARRGRPSTPRS